MDRVPAGVRLLQYLATLPRLDAPLTVVSSSYSERGIAEALGIDRATANRALRLLIDRGDVTQSTARVQGARRPSRVYQLAPPAPSTRPPLAGRTPSPCSASGVRVEAPRTAGRGAFFVGRDAEMRWLAAWLAGPEQGLLVVQGPAGIGKSTLVGRALEEARVATFAHALTPATTTRAFLRALDAFLSARGRRELRSILASMMAPPGIVEKALRTALGGLDAVLVVDNFDRAAKPLAGVIGSLARLVVERDGMPKLVCVQRQAPPPLGAIVNAHRAAGRADVLVVRGLDRDASRELLERREHPRESIDATLAIAHGNPLLLHLIQPGRRAGASQGIQRFLREVSAGLAPAERALLLRAAVHRLPVPAARLASATDAVILASLVKRGFLLKQEGGLAPHDLLREHLLRGLTGAALRGLHAEAARSYASPGRVFDLAPESVRIEVLHHHGAAHEFDEVGRQLRREGLDLITKGYFDELHDILARVPDQHLRARERAFKHMLQGRILIFRGEWRKALVAAKRAMREATLVGDEEVQARAAASIGFADRLLRRFDEGLRVIEGQLERLRGREGAPYHAILLNTYGTLLGESGQLERATAVFERILVHAREHDQGPTVLAKAHTNLGECYRLLGRPEDAIEEGKASLAIATLHGLREIVTSSALTIAKAALDIGDLAQAEPALALAQEHQGRSSTEFTGDILWARGRLRAARGDVADARSDLAGALEVLILFRRDKDAREVERLIGALTSSA